MYIAITALVINLVVATVLTALIRAAKLPAGADETLPSHYRADPPGLRRERAWAFASARERGFWRRLLVSIRPPWVPLCFLRRFFLVWATAQI